MPTAIPENRIDGIYVTEDEKFILEITTSDPYQATFAGTFRSVDSPLGDITYSITKCEYHFVGSNYYPCQIGFSVNRRQEPQWDYDQCDYWCGCRTSNGDLLMSGSRAYITREGDYKVDSFPMVKFKQIK